MFINTQKCTNIIVLSLWLTKWDAVIIIMISISHVLCGLAVVYHILVHFSVAYVLYFEVLALSK